MQARVEQLVINARAPRELVRFYAQLLGGQPVDRARGWSHLQVPGSLRLAFQPAPEDNDNRNRLHLDLEVDDIEVAVDRAKAVGAVRTGDVVTDDAGSCQVMRDPEGNEFCFVCD